MSRKSPNNGGARPGAGHPKGMVASSTLITQLFRKTLAERVEKDAEKWIDAISDAALGHLVMIEATDGSVERVYRKSPDPSAWDKVMDRIYGKAKMEVDVTSGGDKINDLRTAIIALVAIQDDQEPTEDPRLSEDPLQGRERGVIDIDANTVCDIRADIQEALQ